MKATPPASRAVRIAARFAGTGVRSALSKCAIVRKLTLLALASTACASWHRTMTGQDREIVAGHVEHAGQVQDTATKPARKRVTAKQLKATLAAILRLTELLATEQPEAALRLVAEAQELIEA